MENEEKNTQTTPAEDYIAVIQELKANTVPKADYEAVRADNKRLLDSIANGQAHAEKQPEPVPKVDIQALRDELYAGRYEGTDLDYMTKVLKLRKAIMDEGNPDPAVCNGAKTIATQADYDTCEQVCNVLQDIVDYADGDPAVFRMELVRKCNIK